MRELMSLLAAVAFAAFASGETAAELGKRLDAEKSYSISILGDLPFLSVGGNHDLRGGGDKAFDGFVRPLASRALGVPVREANFCFRYGPDAFIFLDFMRPDAAQINALLEEYVPGLVQYEKSRAAGHYLLRVSADGVFVDFFACDSVSAPRTYRLK